MKRILSIMTVVGLLILGGCGNSTQASEQSIFTYLGQTNPTGHGASTFLYRYIDQETGKIVYVIESPTNPAGRAISVVDQ